jgi:polysaccharide chain length determinant protein (PEP-CTERM system associated)
MVCASGCASSCPRLEGNHVLPGRKYTPDDILRLAHRGKWLIVVPFAVCIIGSQIVARRLPDQYRSETLIQLIPQQIPETIVKPNSTMRLEDRLPAISAQILSRTRLERIILDFNLYPDERRVMEDAVVRMRKDIKGPTILGIESFRLSYLGSNPKVAQSVTERLASLYIEENLRDRVNQAQSTNQFLESQLADAKRRLLEGEKRLADYQRQHAGQLPTELPTNLQAIANAQMQLQAVNESSNRARERRLLVERQLADAQTLPAVGVTPETPGTAGPPTAAQQLQAARARLEAYKLQYTADHPDVRALERSMPDLEARADEEARRPPERPRNAAVSPAEAARQKRIRELAADIEVIDHQLAANQVEESALKKRIAEYQAKVDAVPTRQAELVELTRDYQTLNVAYNNLLAKQEESKIAADLQHRQVGEQFRVLDPASVPEKPSNQLLRIGVALGGAFAGLVLGLGLVAFLEYRDSSFRSDEEIARVLNLPVLALVPTLLQERERTAMRRRNLVGLGLAAIVVVLSSAAAVALWRMP